MCHLDVIFFTFFLDKKNGAIAANLRLSRPFFSFCALCALGLERANAVFVLPLAFTSRTLFVRLESA